MEALSISFYWTFHFSRLGLSGDDLPTSGPAYPPDSSAKVFIEKNYLRIIGKLKKGGKFLDVGCMFAQDVRKLVADGAPVEPVYGTDLHSEYFDFAYELFNDRDVIPSSQFFAADILDLEDSPPPLRE